MNKQSPFDNVLADTAECLDEIADQLQENVDNMRAEARSLRAILDSEQEPQEVVQ